jgi:hypothetical protein
MRLVDALEDLTAQEAATLQARKFPDAIAIQNRAAPLVQSLASSAADLPDDLRVRIATLLSRRQASDAWLANEIEIVRAKLQETAETQRRVARFAPAYGRSGVTSRRLSAVG